MANSSVDNTDVVFIDTPEEFKAQFSIQNRGCVRVFNHGDEEIYVDFYESAADALGRGLAIAEKESLIIAYRTGLERLRVSTNSTTSITLSFHFGQFYPA